MAQGTSGLSQPETPERLVVSIATENSGTGNLKNSYVVYGPLISSASC